MEYSSDSGTYLRVFTTIFGGSFLILFVSLFIYTTKMEIRRRRNKKSGIKEKSNQELLRMNDRAYGRVIDANTSKAALKYLSEFDTEVKASDISPKLKSYHLDTIEELTDVYNSTLESEWRDKAVDILSRMNDQFTSVYQNMSFSDVENITRYKNEILRLYAKYWDWTRKCMDQSDKNYRRINLWDMAKSEFRSYFSDSDYDIGVTRWWPDAVSSSVRQQIENKLDEQITLHRPEYIRKKSVIKALMDTVSNNGVMLRADLLKIAVQDASDKEISGTYRMLIRTKRLFEYKEDARYIVCLSDKEQKKRETKVSSEKSNVIDDHIGNMESEDSNNVSPIPNYVMQEDTRDAGSDEEIVLNCLKSRSMEYVDKTSSGGCIYFFDSALAEELNGKGIRVYYAKNGAKSTQNKPAWYVKIG